MSVLRTHILDEVLKPAGLTKFWFDHGQTPRVDDVPLTVATVEWFNVDIIPRSQLDDGWRSIIAGWMRTLGAPDAFS